MVHNSRLVDYAKMKGVRCPVTNPVLLRDWIREAKRFDYPSIVKADGSFGGEYVRLAKDAVEAQRAICEYMLPPAWPSIIRNLIAWVVPLRFLFRESSNSRRVCIQEHIHGPAANMAVACWRGEILATVAVEVVKMAYPNGPASLVKLIDEPEMIAAVSVLVKELKLSGLIGFDFIFDLQGRPFLIEVNPRVTPTCYLRVDGAADLCGALYFRMTGRHAVTQLEVSKNAPIGLFPQELQRLQVGESILSRQFDIPWEDPRLVAELMKTIYNPGWRSRIGNWHRNRRR